MTVKLAVNGYGTIGKRITDAVLRNSDFKLVGVAKYRADYSAIIASQRNIPIYVPRDRVMDFRKIGVEPEGYVDYLFEEAELIYDASPSGTGALNKKIYESLGKPSIFQGGESPEIADASYNTFCNYDKIAGKRYVRVVSCNTTGLLRLLCTLNKTFSVKRALALIIRRAADPHEDRRGPVNSIVLDPPGIPSHHARDVLSVAPWLNITTAAVAAPTTLMHMHFLEVELATPVKRESVLEELEEVKRMLTVESHGTGLDSTSKIVELARDYGRPRYDVYENIIFTDTLRVEDSRIQLFQAVHQEAIVIPENMDAAYAILGLESDPFKVIEKVDRILGVGGLKDSLRSSRKGLHGV